MSIEKSLAIDGWMEPEELKWLSVQAGKHKNIVEIGCFLGRSTYAMADSTKGRVLAIDDFFGPRDTYLVVDGMESKGKSAEIQHRLYSQFCFNMGDLLKIGKVMPLVADHRDISIDFIPDMVFIDGSHEYLDVLDDIRFWKDKIKRGGIICGHDIQFLDVERAVRQIIGEYKVGKNTTIWYKTLN